MEISHEVPDNGEAEMLAKYMSYEIYVIGPLGREAFEALARFVIEKVIVYFTAIKFNQAPHQIYVPHKTKRASRAFTANSIRM